MKRIATRAAPWLLTALLGSGCPTKNVVLGDDVPDRAGTGGGAGVGGSGGAGSGCAVSGEAIGTCGRFLPSSQLYAYHECLNSFDGVDGVAAEQCEGYAPCSYQHEGCLDLYSDGVAGAANSGCAGAPGDETWLSDCGGLGYYGSEIIGAGGVAGGAGNGCDPALNNCGGVGGVGGGPAGTGGAAGAGMTAGEGG
jgi:hypothetical protein